MLSSFPKFQSFLKQTRKAQNAESQKHQLTQKQLKATFLISHRITQTIIPFHHHLIVMPQEFELSSSRNGGINSTVGSSHVGSSHVGLSQDDDEVRVVEIRREISRLQMLERGLAKSSRCFIIKEDEEGRLATKRSAQVRKGISALVGVSLLIGVVFGIMAIARYMKNNDVQFSQGSGGNTPTSLQQLEAHNTVEDCWLILHGDVYDLSSYADRHPGGAYWITDQCGHDGTELYDAFHRTSLLKTVKRFRIGPFVETTAQDDSLDPPGAGGSRDASSEESSDADEHDNEDEDEYGKEMAGRDDGQQVAEPPQEVNYSICRPDCSVPMSELQRHNTANDLWMAVSGVVYDLTDYAGQHPAGSRVVVNVGGTIRTTNEFERYHKAQDILKVTQYIVGNLT